MATKVSIQIASTDTADKKITTNITDVNPEATNATLKQFAQQLNALTTNSYTGLTKTTKEDIY